MSDMRKVELQGEIHYKSNKIRKQVAYIDRMKKAIEYLPDSTRERAEIVSKITFAKWNLIDLLHEYDGKVADYYEYLDGKHEVHVPNYLDSITLLESFCSAT